MESTMKQPTPKVTAADVERIVSRDFPADEFSVVMTILREYGTASSHREPNRVQLAALKLSNGNSQKLRACIERAKADYRDVLSPAEYPGFSKVGWSRPKLPDEEQSRIFESDWRQYDDWLNKPV